MQIDSPPYFLVGLFLNNDMISTITKLLTKWCGTYATSILNVVLYGSIFLGGCYVTHLYYSNVITGIEAKSNETIAKLQAESIKQLEEREAKTAQVISERDNEKKQHDSDINELNAIIERMRINNASSEIRDRESLSTSGSTSPKSTDELLQRSQELQERCARLLVRGVDLSGRISADKDAIVKLTTDSKQYILVLCEGDIDYDINQRRKTKESY